METCFDALWLEDSLNVLWNAGVTNDLFYIIYALNETCSIVVNTPFGQTSSIQIDNLVKQGTALGPVLCSTSIGDYCKENSSPRSGTYIGNACVRPLAFIDDLGDVNKNAEDSEKAHEDAIHFQKVKRLKFGYEKCEILIIGKEKLKTMPSLILDNKEIKIKDSVKYLGNHFNSEGDNAELVKKRVCEAIGIIPDVIAIGKEVSNGQLEIKCTLELYNSLLVNKILFNCQSWSHLKETELKDLEKVQLQTLKQIMRVAYSTSNAGTYLELGILPLRYIIQKRRLAFLHHILTLDNEDPVYMNYILQRNSSNQDNWANEVARIRSQYSLHQSDEEIKLLSKANGSQLLRIM